jgi:signal transduction histidine kinase
LYRIAQEAITNAVRHGRATRVRVGFRQKDGALELTVSDNGRGFVPATAVTAGMGLRIMKYRAAMIGASLEVRSSPGAVATVACTFYGRPHGRENIVR